jgi:hypothetical protein
MKCYCRNLVMATLVLLFGTSGVPSSATSIPKVQIADLFREADFVAIVRVISGDSEHYPKTVYKAEVMTPLKGAKERDTIFFGPFDGYGIGSDHLVFMRTSGAIAPSSDEHGSPYGQIPAFYQVMYSGYAGMPVEYMCVFENDEPNEKCDYGIRLNPEQVLLPRTLKTFPRGPASAVTNYKKWVRRSHMVSMLKQIF